MAAHRVATRHGVTESWIMTRRTWDRQAATGWGKGEGWDKGRESRLGKAGCRPGKDTSL